MMLAHACTLSTCQSPHAEPFDDPLRASVNGLHSVATKTEVVIQARRNKRACRARVTLF